MPPRRKKIIVDEYKPSCLGCAFFFTAPGMDEAGFCRRYPPTPYKEEGDPGAMFPMVLMEWVCGEFKQKLNS